ncbi:alpha-amylase family glycosyl hydrolase [Clostridium oryzae]|uniref:Alpha-amylase 2 n=1 Tax=Clostridium oryzae TaxID=1450648 RepID=A0A1V4IW75_9CLOT|nr:alpha-amylase family glycosyl hydrolase [Clostridium oryzae]OPJ64196.1 alpha-amylase 2 [Clostridium oryzae]
MAKNTDIKLRNSTIYSVYVRNHTKEGDFKGVTEDLDRIADLGVDIIWLMPIHPIGQVNKKGKLGCPYSIQDYRKVNPEYGTLEDFKELISETHKRGMKLIIDVVYNHTSHESELLKSHPEYFYRKEDGQPGNKVGGWSDIIDLDYDNKELWDYQIETLKYWVLLGVDGFRCDVAHLVPIEFWTRARREVASVKKNAIWLAESADSYFLKELRQRKIMAHSDSEVFQAFDIAYDYDTYKYFAEYLRGERGLSYVLEAKRNQDFIYPENYVKLRFLENHDNPRITYYLKEETDLKNWTAFMFFEKGAALIYAGQEAKDDNTPDLFNSDPVNWNKDIKFYEYIKKLIQIKKADIFAYGQYEILQQKKIGVIEARYEYKGRQLIGIFNVERKIGSYKLNIKDGTYNNLIDGRVIQVSEGKIELQLKPIILEA